MSADHYYNLCCKNIGAPVEVTTHDGAIHRGIIDKVDRERLFLRPMEAPGGAGGYGTYLWGWGWGLGTGIALGSIATLAFLPLFWW